MADDEPEQPPATEPPKRDQAEEAKAAPPIGRITPKAAPPRPTKASSPAEKRAEIKAKAIKKAPVPDPRKAARSGDPRKAATAVKGSARYTPPTPSSSKVSPIWVPILMFTLLGLGMVLIFLNYIAWPFGDPSNVRLIIGLVMILGGILVATQYH